jgi:hypothetical protein
MTGPSIFSAARPSYRSRKTALAASAWHARVFNRCLSDPNAMHTVIVTGVHHRRKRGVTTRIPFI